MCGDAKILVRGLNRCKNITHGIWTYEIGAEPGRAEGSIQTFFDGILHCLYIVKDISLYACIVDVEPLLTFFVYLLRHLLKHHSENPDSVTSCDGDHGKGVVRIEPTSTSIVWKTL